MTMIPNFKAVGLFTSDHDLGAAMSQSPRPERGLPRLYSSKVIPDFRAVGASDHDLGAAMSQSPRPERGLPRLYSSKAVTERKEVRVPIRTRRRRPDRLPERSLAHAGPSQAIRP
jgi:hypothetical protein